MQRSTQRRGAGDSARRRYRYLYRAWRRRVWPLLAAFGTVGIACSAVGWVLAGGWSWGFAFAGGLSIGALLWMLASPPTRILSWQWGSEGERRTARRLRALKSEHWQVWHDLLRPDGTNIDHVVAGPAGLFVPTVRTGTAS